MPVLLISTIKLGYTVNIRLIHEEQLCKISVGLPTSIQTATRCCETVSCQCLISIPLKKSEKPFVF